MARPRVIDLMQDYSFWLFDASRPSPLPVLSPLLGFSSIDAPELELEHRRVDEGNSLFPRYVVQRGSVSEIGLSRGVRFNNSDFYLWAKNALKGREPVRRTLVLLHFMGLTVLPRGPELGLVEMVRRVPGRVFVLYQCLPKVYRAGSRFDANSSAVSVQELRVQPRYWAELTVASLGSGVGGAAGAIGAGISDSLNLVSVLL